MPDIRDEGQQTTRGRKSATRLEYYTQSGNGMLARGTEVDSRRVCFSNDGDSKREGGPRRHGGTEREGGELDRMTG